MDTKNVESFYPLSPMQQGMLFHSMFDPGSGIYVEQLSCTLLGSLDINAFERAWQQAARRHDILRTSFIGESLKEPVQVVHREIDLKIDRLDWQNLSQAQQKIELQSFLSADRQRGFTLSKPPLLRLTIIQLEPAEKYQFIWTHHHILLDGWSIPILMNDVLTFYEAFRTGKDIPILPSTPFRNYIVWLKKQDLNAAETYWRKVLRGFSTPTSLVVNYEKPVSELPFKEAEIWLSEETTSNLSKLAQANSITLSTFIQGSWGILLGRYNDETDVLFGATVSGRPPELPNSESMVGLFINTLPVRIQIEPHKPALVWFKDLQNQLVEMRNFEYTPLVNIQGWSEIPRDLPLFRSILVFENYPVNSFLQGQKQESLQIQNVESVEQTNYALNLIAGAAERMMLKIVADSSFDCATIQRMLGHLKTILESLAAHPHQTVGQIPILTDEEYKQIIKDWNYSPSNYPLHHSFVELFEKQVSRTPQAAAVSFEGQQLTYKELNQRANQLAHYLLKHGFKNETLVGICFERSIEMIIAILGVLKAGGAFLPIDPQYPSERIKFMLHDSQASLIITQSTLLDHLPPAKLEIISIDTDPVLNGLKQSSDSNPSVPIEPDHLAYVIYTSGSTGTPKGTLLHHRGAVNMACNTQSLFNINNHSRVLQFASISFDASIAEIFPAFMAGAELCLAKTETLLSPSGLKQLAYEKQITTITCPPSYLSALTPEDFPTFETVVSAGEACPVKLARRWFSKVRFVNGYGPTEATVASSYYVVSDIPKNADHIPIGRPISNLQLYILDSNQRPLPIGVPGELYIGGVGIAHGYLNRPELTAERFIPDPFSNTPSAHLYKTGDLVRYQPDGNIIFLGRKDYQVKVRGFRVELTEVEAALNQLAPVKSAVVLAQGSSLENKMLAAFILPKDPRTYNADTIRELLRSKLPAYMLPSVYIKLDALPTLPNGKIDRKALPIVGIERPTLKNEFIAPRDTIELQLAQIWEDVLEIHPVSVKDDFFELGGHSLQALRIAALVQKKLNVNVMLNNLFEEPTIEHLAVILRSLQSDNPACSSLVPIQPKGSQPPLFFVHPSGGSIHWYSELAYALGSEQPFFAFQSPDLIQREINFTRIEEMAAYYLKLMRETQPNGPYYLGSWSMGVVIAFEMAQQLYAQGQEVGLLALFDQGPFVPQEEPENDADYLYTVFKENLAISLEHLQELSYSDQLYYIWTEARKEKWIYPDFTFDQFSFFVRILRTHTDAWRKYIPQPYPGKITLFVAEKGDHSYSDRNDLGWSEYAAGGVEILEVEGDHISMMHKPHVRALARVLQDTLQKIPEKIVQ